ncbi:MAG: molybdopterin-dependent oxidoreductase [Roseivivax sp.]|nr:molybdopterin-dependent oxidoreductase [Roseivivax sp.]
MSRILGLVIVCATAWLPAILMAGEPLLTVSGSGLSKEYDRAALMEMGKVEITTTTTWTDGQQTFTGVPLSAILADAGVTAGTIKATAINDYAVAIPVAEVLGQDWPIVAYELNGEEMSVREKGPLWIVYPYDSDPAYRSEIVYSRSVWQLDRLEIEP